MKRGKQIDTWYPFFIDKWLFGSTRHELIINADWRENFPELVPLLPESILNAPVTDLRGIFQDILTMSKKDGGFVRSNETMPYPLSQLAGMWCVPLDWLKATIAICLHARVGKLIETSPGIYYLASNEIYSMSKKPIREPEGPDFLLFTKEDQLPRFIRCPKEYSEMATQAGMVRMSRLIAAVAVGRALRKEEEVHHVNKHDEDDRPENLMLFGCHKDHLRYQFGDDIKPLWDGRLLGEKEKAALLAALSADKTALLLEDRREKKSKGYKPYPDAFATEDVRLTELLIELMRKNNPESSILRRLTPEGRGRWADVSRKLREIDKRTSEEIEAVIRFSQEDTFWSSNILSMPTLREKWDRLVLKAKLSAAEGRASRVGASAPATDRQKEIARQVGAYIKRLWAEASPALEAARTKGPKAFRELQEQKEREIARSSAELSRRLQSEVNP